MPDVADHPSGSNENNSWADLTTREKTDRLIDTSDGNKIYPLTFPKPGASPSLIENLADNIRSSGEQISETGYDITAAWAGLSSCYQAPHQEELYEVLDPVSSDGDRVMYGMNRAANALEDFAETLEGIQSRWDTLITDSYEFRARVADEGDEWRDAEGIKGFFGIGQSGAVEENNALVQRGANLIEEYEEAERDCANLINSNVVNRTRFEGAPADGELDEDVFYHGHEDDLSDLVTEWGVEATTDEHWWVDAGTAVWDFGVGAVEGVGGALGMHSSEGWFNMSWGDAMLEYHEGNLQSALGLVGMYDEESGYGWSGWDSVGESWKDLAHSVVPWEEWGERPWYVIGTAALNIGATVGGAVLSATGVGATVGVPLMAWRGAAMLDGMGPGRGGSGDAGIDGANLDVDLPPGQRYGGPDAPVVQIDANTFDTGNFSQDQLSGMRDSLNRVQNLESGGGSGSRPTGPSDGPEGSRPTHSTTPADHDLADRPAETQTTTETDTEAGGETGNATHENTDASSSEQTSSTGENGQDPTTEQLSESDRLLNQVEEMFSDQDHARFRANENAETAMVDGNRAGTDPGSSNLTEAQVAERYGLDGDANSTFSDMRATASDYPHVPWEGGPGESRPSPGADPDKVPAPAGGPDNNTLNAQADPPHTSGGQHVDLTGTGGSPGSSPTPGTSPDVSGNRHDVSMQDNNSPVRNSVEDGNGNNSNYSDTTQPSATTGPAEGGNVTSTGPDGHTTGSPGDSTPGGSTHGPDPNTEKPATALDKWGREIEFGSTDGSGRWFDEDGVAHIEGPEHIKDARAYSRIRENTEDIEQISEVTGIDKDVVARIKDHIFFRDHEVAVGPNDVRTGRFSPMSHIASWWEKAPLNKIPADEQQPFRRWLEHESVESRLMERGMPYLSSDRSAFKWDDLYEGYTPTPTADQYGAHNLAPHEGSKGPFGHYRNEWEAPEIKPNRDLSNADEIADIIFERFHRNG